MITIPALVRLYGNRNGVHVGNRCPEREIAIEISRSGPIQPGKGRIGHPCTSGKGKANVVGMIAGMGKVRGSGMVDNIQTNGVSRLIGGVRDTGQCRGDVDRDSLNLLWFFRLLSARNGKSEG